MAISNRYDFVLLFDVKDGNPNGDPDAGNLPRIDAETGRGLVTDVCLKRKVRNFVQLTHSNDPGLYIFVKSKEISGEETVLNRVIREAHEELGHDLTAKVDADGRKREKDGKAQGSEVAKARKFLCDNFFDIRTFGAVMSTGPNAGQVRGPVQITFARSFDPIVVSEHSLTVSAARMEEKGYDEQVGIQGRKFTVPYGLYMAHGFVSANLADQTGFNENDLSLLWQALSSMFEHDRSAARGLMATRGLYVFKHDSKLGNAPAHDLFDRVGVKKIAQGPARQFSDYQVQINEQNMPEGVVLQRVLG
ncbi:type I-C CRISPR-associated protein Cas7/Csd2 [uncultured Tolumonas sp.]|uniref:type I-C CRISPR-associated protein Cas7/Csd2 n=1 Tax=uncultured Tolumonas sp. TaxID=263765 RepID=UPI00292F2CDB|nr:type I-C CRISPR-associated protein Cas7/Csd2 [uncultured Tolumonas sp.]